MGCLIVLFALISPRLALLILWIFTNEVSRAFGSFIWPLVGIIILPWTTLAFTLVAAPAGPVRFWGWLVVLVGLLADLTSYQQANSQSGRPTTA